MKYDQISLHIVFLIYKYIGYSKKKYIIWKIM